MNLINQLPTSSRYRAALIGASPQDRWGNTDYLLAHLSDLQQQLFQLTYVIGSHGKKPPNLERIPRPGEKKRRDRPSFLRIVDDETGELVESERDESAEANERARARLPGLAKKKKPEDAPGTKPEEG